MLAGLDKFQWCSMMTTSELVSRHSSHFSIDTDQDFISNSLQEELYLKPKFITQNYQKFFELLIKSCKILFWFMTENLLGLLSFNTFINSWVSQTLCLRMFTLFFQTVFIIEGVGIILTHTLFFRQASHWSQNRCIQNTFVRLVLDWFRSKYTGSLYLSTPCVALLTIPT